jgi:ABC-2 type transport system permease protein
MLDIARTEWLKIKKYPAFWWVMGITALTYPGINYMFIHAYFNIVEKSNATGKIVQALLGNPFAFPETWRTVGYFSSLFIFIPAIVIIMLITNEFTYKTNRQNIIDGWSRRDFMTGKLIDVIILSLIVTALFAAVAMVIGLTNTSDPAASKTQMAHYIGLFFLQSLCQLSLAFLVGLVVRKSFIALAVFAFYYIIVEPVAYNLIRVKLDSNAGQYLPLEISHQLLPRPAFFMRFDQKAYETTLKAVNPHIAYSILLLLLTWVICFWLYSRKDL